MAKIQMPTHTLDCGCVFKGTANKYEYCQRHAPIIKKGEDRARFGQRNTFDRSTPFENKREQPPRNAQSRAVWEHLIMLRADMVQLMVDPDEWHRISDIERLCKDQLRDDAGYTFERIGRATVEQWFEDDGEELYPQLSTEQLALAEAMESFLEKLPELQQEVIRQKYHMRLSERDIADRMQVKRDTVRSYDKRGRASLLKEFLKEWPNEPADS